MRAKFIECNSPRCGFNKDIIDIWMRGMDKGYESALLGDCAIARVKDIFSCLF